MAQTHFKTNMFRKNAIRNVISPKYRDLCSETVPYTEELLGTDISKTVTELENQGKLSLKWAREVNIGLKVLEADPISEDLGDLTTGTLNDRTRGNRATTMITMLTIEELQKTMDVTDEGGIRGRIRGASNA